MNRRELEFRLQSLFEGDLDQESLVELQRELETHPEAREAYFDYAQLHNALQLRAEGIDLLRVVPMDQVNRRRQRKFITVAIVAAAAAVVIGAAVMGIIHSRAPRPTLKFVTAPGTDVLVSHYLSGGESPEGSCLEPGSSLEIRRGTVEVDFASGVRGIVRGPAHLTLHHPGLLHLAEGTAWFEVPPGASGFQVSTPDLILTDLGTEFGVVSKADFLHEVHVFRGTVEVANRNGLQNKELLEAGQARVAEPAGQWRSIPVDPKPFLKKLPKVEVLPVESEVIVTEESSANRFKYMAEASPSDLLHGLIPKTSGWNFLNHAHPNEIADGIHGADFDKVPGDMVQGGWTTVGATATYHLGAGPDGLGHVLTSIRSIAAWNGAGFGNQTWAVEVKPVNGEFTQLCEVNYEPFVEESLNGGGATKVVLTGKSGTLAQGVEFIRFTAGRVPTSVDGAFVWREIDVFGVPATSPPKR